MQTVFRYILLIGIFVIIIFLANIDNKFPIMIGGIIGVTIAFIVSYFIIKRRKK